MLKYKTKKPFGSWFCLILFKNNGQEENQVASFCNLIFDFIKVSFFTVFSIKIILILRFSYYKTQPPVF